MDFLNPTEILNQLELRDDMVAADFGSGSGGWVLPLAQKLKFGKVYAIDILEEALQALKTKMEITKVKNVRLIKADLEQGLGSSIQTGLLDLVIASNLLFQVKDKKAVVAEAKRVLQTGGRLLIVDWLPQVALGPVGPAEGRVSAEEVKELAESLGFVLEKTLSAGAGTHHWVLLFKEL